MRVIIFNVASFDPRIKQVVSELSLIRLTFLHNDAPVTPSLQVNFFESLIIFIIIHTPPLP